MPYRTRMLEQLMRTILETQAAMLSAMTEMQQALLSAMILRKPEEVTTDKPVETRPPEAVVSPNQQASRPETPRAKPEPQPRRSNQRRTGQLAATSPQRRPTKRTSAQPSWFEQRGESHHLSEHGVKHLRGLFDQGLSQSEAARQMGLTPAAVRRRFHEWRGKAAA
jgi:hypothetical protein